MADIAAFPTLHDVLVTGNNLQGYTAGEDMKAGQVVGFDISETTELIIAMHAVAGENAIGVLIFDVLQGDLGTVAEIGCVVNMVNADDAADIHAGADVIQHANAVGGTVSEYAGSGAGQIVGQAREFNTGGAAGIAKAVLVNPRLEVIT